MKAMGVGGEGGFEPVLCHSVNGREKYVPEGRDLAVTLLLIIYFHAENGFVSTGFSCLMLSTEQLFLPMPSRQKKLFGAV